MFEISFYWMHGKLACVCEIRETQKHYEIRIWATIIVNITLALDDVRFCYWKWMMLKSNVNQSKSLQCLNRVLDIWCLFTFHWRIKFIDVESQESLINIATHSINILTMYCCTLFRWMDSSLKVFRSMKRSSLPGSGKSVYFCFYFILEEAKPIFQCHQTAGCERKMFFMLLLSGSRKILRKKQSDLPQLGTLSWSQNKRYLEVE